MPKTLILDSESWDLTLDDAGQIRVAVGAYAVAQNVANRIRLFTNDAWYDSRRGIPHFELDLGLRPSPAAVRASYTKAALDTEGVAGAAVEVLYNETDKKGERVQGGDIRLTLTDGGRATVIF